jgi:hypothetical protein
MRRFGLQAFLPEDFPHKLAEGERMEFKDQLYATQARGDHVSAVLIYDSTGGRWKLPKIDLKAIRKGPVGLPAEIGKRR